MWRERQESQKKKNYLNRSCLFRKMVPVGQIQKETKPDSRNKHLFMEQGSSFPTTRACCFFDSGTNSAVYG